MCAITRPTSTYVGKTSWLYIHLESNNGSVRDGGNYHYYAGPVVAARSGSMDLDAEVRLQAAYGGLTYETSLNSI